MTEDPLCAPGPDTANPAPARWWSTGDSDGSYLVRWVIGILGLSACSVMAAGAQVGAGLILATAAGQDPFLDLGDLPNDDNVRASGLMFGSWWVWTLPARARFDRVMPS